MSQRIPPAKGSAHTMVGLGAVEFAANGNGGTHREESPTPPSGTVLPPDLRMMAPEELALYAIEQVGETRDELIRRDANRKAADDRRDGKIDALITEVRALMADSRSRDEALFGLLGMPTTVEKLAAATLANQDAIVALADRIADSEEARDDLAASVDSLSKQLGQPPQKLDQRSSQVGELTAEELTELEQGTGLAGVVGRLVAGQARLTKRVGIGAAVAAASAPVAVEIIKAIFGG